MRLVALKSRAGPAKCSAVLDTAKVHYMPVRRAKRWLNKQRPAATKTRLDFNIFIISINFILTPHLYRELTQLKTRGSIYSQSSHLRNVTINSSSKRIRCRRHIQYYNTTVRLEDYESLLCPAKRKPSQHG